MSAVAERLGPRVAPPPDPLDDLDRAGRRRRTAAWIGALSVLLVVTMVLAVGLGPVAIAPGTVAQIITHHLLGTPQSPHWSFAEDNIVWLVRMPRVLLGAVVGAALAVCGVALQALMRNILADPFLFGTSSGASTGAAASILFGVGSGLGSAALTASAFAGALAATALVFATARIGGRITSVRLVLAGIAVAYALSALTSFLMFALRQPRGHPRDRLLPGVTRTKFIPYPAVARYRGFAAMRDLTPGIPMDWQNVRLDAHVTDLATGTARRINVGVGASSRGFPVSTKYAVEPVVRPKRARGHDMLTIIDVRPDSPTYLEVARSVQIAQMTHRPVAGVNPVYPTYERRFAAITPDGAYAFVTRGGDSKLDVVNTKSGAVSTVAVPSSLTGGGHITAFQVGFTPYELSGR